MDFFTAFWDGFTRELFRVVGSGFGSILQALLYIFVCYLLWGIIWDRILTKAGYKGNAFKWRFVLLSSPVLIAPIYKFIPYSIYEWIAGVVGVLWYLTLWSLAVMPWNRIAKIEPENTKPENVNRDLVNLKNKTGIHFKEPPKQ
jgi:hypothetical protein